eukprot:COSAG02_NODE_18_length_54986_cov_345.599322_22_plen_192_part_00
MCCFVCLSARGPVLGPSHNKSLTNWFSRRAPSSRPCSTRRPAPRYATGGLAPAPPTYPTAAVREESACRNPHADLAWVTPSPAPPSAAKISSQSLSQIMQLTTCTRSDRCFDRGVRGRQGAPAPAERARALLVRARRHACRVRGVPVRSGEEATSLTVQLRSDEQLWQQRHRADGDGPRGVRRLERGGGGG